MADKLGILINTILNVKQEDLQKQLDSVAKKIKINLKPRIDFDENVIAKFKSDVDKLAKNIKLNLRFDVDKQSVKDAEKTVTETAKEISEKSKSQNKIKVFDKEQLEAEGRQFFISATGIVNRVKNQFKDLGDVNVNFLKNAKNQIVGFEAEIKKLDGTIEKLRFDMAKIKVGDSTQKGFVFSGANLIDKNIGDVLQRNLNTLQKFETRLRNIRDSFTSSRGVKEANNLAILNKEYNSILSTIEKLRKSHSNLTEEQKRNIDKQINNLRSLYKAYRDIEITAEKGFNFKQFENITGQVIKLRENLNATVVTLKNYKDALSTPLLQGYRLNELKNVQETKEYLKLTQELQKGNEFVNLTAYIDKATGSIYKYSHATRNAMIDTLTWSKAIQTAWKRMAQWAAGGTLFFGTLRLIKEGIAYITELDNSLNEIRIVTNKTQQEVNNLALSYNKLAKEMNVTTKEVASTAADLFRQGLDEGQVEERMRAVIQYAKISGISLEESNKIITATANATGESVRKIVDIFAYLGDATASGAEEIGEALQKVASTAENSGVSLEKAASWIATISSITRESASSIGNSLKTIISRYEQIKAKGFNEEDATQINDVTKALQAVGIVAVDAQGQLRPIAEVLDELGAKWNSLTKNEQAYVATTLAGTYQRNRLITLLDNYNDSLKNYEIALNSAGTAEQKFAIYQDSVQAKLDKLSATWEEFWQKSLNSELIKGTIQALTTLIDTFGNLQTVLSLVATGFALWKGNKILNFFKILPKQIKTSITSMQLFKDIQTATMMVAKGEATAIQGLSLSFQSLGMSIKAAIRSNPLGWIAVGLTIIISLVDVFNQKQEEMRQKIEDAAQKAKEQSNSIAELMGKYNELIDLVDKDENARTQLQSVQDELIKTLGLEKEAIDLVNDSREESIKKIREEAIEKLKANENALIAAKNLAEEEKKNKHGSSSFLGIRGYEYVGSPILSDKENKAFNLMKTISGLRVERSALGTFILMADYMATAEEKAEILETALEALKDAGLENTNVFNQLARSQQGYNDVINKAKEANDAYNKNIAQQLILQKENEIGIPKTVQEFKNFRKAILDNSNGTEDFKRVLDELLSQEYPQFVKQTKDNSNSILDLSKSYEDLLKSIEDLLKSISNTSDDLKTLNQILNDVQNGQSLNAETVLDLIQKHEELIPAIHKTADGWTIEKDAIENLRKAKIEEARVAIENQINSAEATLDNVYARVKAYGIEIAAIEDLKSAQREASKLGFKKGFGENAFENIKFDDSTNTITLGDKITKWSKGLYDIIKKSFNEQKLINDTILKIGELKERNKKLLELLSDPNFGVSSSKSSSSKSTEIYEAEINQFQQLEDALAKVNDEIERNQALTDIAEDKDKINLLSKRIDLYKEEQKILHQLAEARRSVIQQNVGKLQGLGFDIFYDRNANELVIRNMEHLNQLKGKDAEATNKLRKETEELINTTLSLNDANRQAGTQYIQLDKEIKSIREEQKKYAEDLIESYQEYLLYTIDKQIEKYEELKKSAQERAKREIDNLNAEIERLERKNEELKEQEEREKRLSELAKQRELVENIQKERNVRILQDGEWVYVADPKKLKEETDKLKEMEEDYSRWEEENRRENRIQRLKDQIKEIEDELAEEEKRYDEKIKKLQDFTKAHQEEIDKQKFQVTSYSELVQSLAGIEEKSYKQRLDLLDEFVKAYNELMSSIKTEVPTGNVYISDGTNKSSGSSGGGSSISSSKGATGYNSTDSNTGKWDVLKYDTGGVNDYTGLAILHGKPNAVETVFNAEQGKKLYDFVKNLPYSVIDTIMPKINIPTLTGIGNKTSNVYYNVHIDKVETKDADSFVKLLPTLVHQYK